MQDTIDQLIINSPYDEPSSYWRYDRQTRTFSREAGRRSAGYEERAHQRFFFCQLEAIETLIWLTEAAPAERQGLVIPGDGGPFPRLCAKMATGAGKTIVMAMLIAGTSSTRSPTHRISGSAKISSSWRRA